MWTQKKNAEALEESERNTLDMSERLWSGRKEQDGHTERQHEKTGQHTRMCCAVAVAVVAAAAAAAAKRCVYGTTEPDLLVECGVRCLIAAVEKKVEKGLSVCVNKGAQHLLLLSPLCLC